MAHSLDLSNPSIRQTIGPEDPQPSRQKFLEFEVVKVVNPRRLAAIFEVYYHHGDRAPLYLGTFSLFPPDNPGKFIVATRGLLERDGTIVLSLVKPEEAEAGDTLRVDLARIGFREQ